MIYLSFDVYFLNENSFYVIYYTTTQLIYIRYYHNEGGKRGKEEEKINYCKQNFPYSSLY